MRRRTFVSFLGLLGLPFWRHSTQASSVPMLTKEPSTDTALLSSRDPKSYLYLWDTRLRTTDPEWNEVGGLLKWPAGVGRVTVNGQPIDRVVYCLSGIEGEVRYIVEDDNGMPLVNPRTGKVVTAEIRGGVVEVSRPSECLS
jgi:hypothetical protein